MTDEVDLQVKLALDFEDDSPARRNGGLEGAWTTVFNVTWKKLVRIVSTIIREGIQIPIPKKIRCRRLCRCPTRPCRRLG